LAATKNHQAFFFGLNKLSPLDDYPAVYAVIMIPTTVPSAITLSTDNDRSALAVDAPKAAIVVAMADPHVDFLCECGDCNAQSHNRRNSQKPAPHRIISSSIYAATKGNIYGLNAAPSGKFRCVRGRALPACATLMREHGGMRYNSGRQPQRIRPAES
jgi:hypothetical protein